MYSETEPETCLLSKTAIYIKTYSQWFCTEQF